MNYLVDHGFSNQVSLGEVVKAIIKLRGPDRRTINNWLKALEVLGYLIPESLNLYRVNLSHHGDLLVKAMKSDVKQKKLM